MSTCGSRAGCSACHPVNYAREGATCSSSSGSHPGRTILCPGSPEVCGGVSKWCALLHRPELLLLDEPTTGIDAEERAILWRELLDGARGTTVLLATNDLGEADAVCDNVAFIQSGQVVISGTPAALKADLRRESVRIGLTDESAAVAARIAAISGTGELALDGETIVVTTDDASTFVPRLLRRRPARSAL